MKKQKFVISIFFSALAVSSPKAAENDLSCKLDGKKYSLGAIVTKENTIYQCTAVFFDEIKKPSKSGWVKIDSESRILVP